MLHDGGQVRSTLATSQSLGFVARGASAEAAPGAVAVVIPGSVEGEQSVCGLKAFLVDERRTFTAEDGSRHTIDCAKLAVLDISDSPVHVHGETVETYHILAGSGRMVLGGRAVRVQPGTVVVIPPGTPHGLCSDDPAAPVRVLMTFAPGLASIHHQQFRDERIVASASSAVLARLGGGASPAG